MTLFLTNSTWASLSIESKLLQSSQVDLLPRARFLTAQPSIATVKESIAFLRVSRGMLPQKVLKNWTKTCLLYSEQNFHCWKAFDAVTKGTWRELFPEWWFNRWSLPQQFSTLNEQFKSKILNACEIIIEVWEHNIAFIFMSLTLNAWDSKLCCCWYIFLLEIPWNAQCNQYPHYMAGSKSMNHKHPYCLLLSFLDAFVRSLS